MIKLDNTQILSICLHALVNQTAKDDSIIIACKELIESRFRECNIAYEQDSLTRPDHNFEFWYRRSDYVCIGAYTQDIIFYEFCCAYDVEGIPDYIMQDIKEGLLDPGNQIEILSALSLSPHLRNQLKNNLSVVLDIFNNNFEDFLKQDKELLHDDQVYFEIICSHLNKGLLSAIYLDSNITEIIQWVSILIDQKKQFPHSTIILLILFKVFVFNKKVLSEKIENELSKVVNSHQESIDNIYMNQLFTLLHKIDFHSFEKDNPISEIKDFNLKDFIDSSNIRLKGNRRRFIEYLAIKKEADKEGTADIYDECYNKNPKSTSEEKRARNTISKACKEINDKLGVKILFQDNYDVWWERPKA